MDPIGMNVRELKAHLDAIPDDYLDLEVVVMLQLDGEDDELVPGVITQFEQFPATVQDPQPAPVVFHIYAREGTSTAAEIESLGRYQRFLDGDPPA